jgi:DNA mismatch endonuclease, patch repair protein
MVDNLNAEQRKECMKAVRAKNTAPEICVRSLVHKMGYRYSLHKKALPGKPDLVLVSRKKVIFVHGCFWHRHSCSQGRKVPESHSEYWSAKLERNAFRDKAHSQALRKNGWKVFVVWECWTRDIDFLKMKLDRFLRSS